MDIVIEEVYDTAAVELDLDATPVGDTFNFDYEVCGSDVSSAEVNEEEEPVIEAVQPPAPAPPHPRPRPRRHRRAKFSSHTKWLLAYEQDYKCAICCDKLPPSMEIDHRRPLWAGGSNERDNIWLLCPACHSTKTFMENERRYRLSIAKELHRNRHLPLTMLRPLSAAEKVIANRLVAVDGPRVKPDALVRTRPPVLVERSRLSLAPPKKSGTFVCCECGDVVSPCFRHACTLLRFSKAHVSARYRAVREAVDFLIPEYR
jgi:hypothetical protein